MEGKVSPIAEIKKKKKEPRRGVSNTVTYVVSNTVTYVVSSTVTYVVSNTVTYVVSLSHTW